jgi:hypothetical protein
MMTKTPTQFLTLGEMALRVGILSHNLRHLAAQDRVPHVRGGRYYLFDPADLDAIRDVVRAAGYLRDQTPVPAA